MSKSRNRKWYEYDDEDSYDKKKSRKDERRNQKKMKNAMKARNLDYFEQEEDNR